jgi:hypothetical protein
LIERNRRKFPHAIFWEIGTDPKDPYDLVCSLYTIEHVVRPVEYLELLWSYCRSGGIIGIICPDYIDGDGIPLSVYFGSSALRIREKVMRGRFWDLACHLYEWKVLAPKWKQKAREMKSGAFWMNLDPSDLAGHPHRIDGDAVHFPRLSDLVQWFENKGAEILETSQSLQDAHPPTGHKHPLYLLARKAVV